jgi:hypothetical protein
MFPKAQEPLVSGDKSQIKDIRSPLVPLPVEAVEGLAGGG